MENQAISGMDTEFSDMKLQASEIMNKKVEKPRADALEIRDDSEIM